MSKRTRGTANRNAPRKPAQNRPASGRAASAPTRPAPAGTPAADAALVAETRGVATETAAASDTRATASVRTRAKPSSALAARAASEYVYVAQDLRRIAAVAALLFAIMFALWLVLEVVRIRI